ncbi:receptor-like protein 20 [Corylus avellana]|uniref:receptor-like protein 20 n=1 Tax=Corylus avellana TaxID=13451 RepID=UPI00286AFE30|nr:receptor-like protein 20 [Corylus avellana]
MKISFLSWLFLMPIYSLLLHFCISVAFCQTLGDQQSLMLQLKKSLLFNRDRSTKLVHWNQSVDCCLWEGVTCSDGRVTSLDLSRESISGTLDNASSLLFSLQDLQSLDLSYNSLEGSIPISLFSLPSLLQLQLSNNQFSGQLNEFPDVSSSLLDTLDLSNNNLKGPIPMSVFELKGLKILSLSSNNFTGSLQPNMIQKLTSLSYLDLSDNSLSIEYDETNFSLSSLPWLWTFNLASNKLKTFPVFLRNQSELLHLDLSGNEIQGEIPSWIWGFRNLYELNLSHNYLESLDLPLLNMSFVTILDLHSNQLQGQLSVLPSYAKYLDFSENNFSSVIPASIGNSLTYANFFSISSNKFYGSIPGSLCNATYLLALDLSDNLLSGPVLQCLIEMSPRVLNLRKNNLTGSIPNTFPSNCGLLTLNLNGNQLEGKLPNSLANCTSLEILDLGNNNIEDAFPCYLKKIATMGVLILRSNKFYGPIDCLEPSAAWPNLQIADLASNNFVGKFQIKSFSSWKAMMEEEKMTSQLNYLQYEVLSWDIYYQNKVTLTFKGLQAELVKILTIFTSIDFSCNNFEGPILAEIGELKSLYIFNLSHNSFDGQIPQSLGELAYLESLDLSSNKLTGEIPVQLADGLIFLSVLNLSFNQLVGKIPQIKQFATFSETSYEGNIGLCDFPLKKKCTHEESGLSPPTSEETHSNSENAIDGIFLSADLGYVFGLAIVIGPLMFWKKWRICFYKHADDIFFKMFPLHYIKIENRPRRAHRNNGRGARINQGRRH